MYLQTNRLFKFLQYLHNENQWLTGRGQFLLYFICNENQWPLGRGQLWILGQILNNFSRWPTDDIIYQKSKLMALHFQEGRFLCPRHKMAGTYSVPLFRPSVIPSSSVSDHYLSNGCTYSTQIWHIWIYNEKIQAKFEFGHGPMIFDRVMPLDEILSFRSLSPQQLYTFNSNLRYGYVISGQVWIWPCFEEFWQSYTPFTLKIIWHFQFPFIISPNSCTHSTQIWHMDTLKEYAGQVRIWSWFDDFWQIYAHFKYDIFSFRSLSP
jgi:hypothetical protein